MCKRLHHYFLQCFRDGGFLFLPMQDPIRDTPVPPMAETALTMAKALVRKMHEKKPPGSRLTVDVCVSVLQKKFADKIAPLAADALRAAVASELAKLDAPPPRPAAGGGSGGGGGGGGGAADDDDDDDDESDDESFASEDDEESDDDDDDESSSDGSLGDSESGEDAASDDEDASGSEAAASSAAASAPAKKKHRSEGAASSHKSGGGGGAGGAGSPEKAAKREATDEEYNSDKHVLAMVKFLEKGGAKVARRPRDGESLQAYRDAELVPLFEANKLNARDVGKKAFSKWQWRKEAEELAKEADVNLDRRQRKGRACFGTKEEMDAMAAAAPANPAFKYDTGLFDE